MEVLSDSGCRRKQTSARVASRRQERMGGGERIGGRNRKVKEEEESALCK